MSENRIKNTLSNEHLKFIENISDKELQARLYTLYLEYITKIEKWCFYKYVAIGITIIICITVIRLVFF